MILKAELFISLPFSLATSGRLMKSTDTKLPRLVGGSRSSSSKGSSASSSKPSSKRKGSRGSKKRSKGSTSEKIGVESLKKLNHVEMEEKHTDNADVYNANTINANRNDGKG